MTPLEKIHAVERAETLAIWLDARFRLPGTGLRFGFDAILGLVPGLGDTITALIGLYMLRIGRQIELSRHDMGRMAANLVWDWLIGLVPLFGDGVDLLFRAHLRNAAILRRHLQKTVPASRRRRPSPDEPEQPRPHPSRQTDDSPPLTRYG